MVVIENDLIYKTTLLSSSTKGYYMAYVDGIVINPHNSLKTFTTHRFIFDTGAAITILNRSFNYLFIDRETQNSNTPSIDNITIQYGSGRRTLPVYKVKIKIKGTEFKLLAAHDKNMVLHSLLGNFDFINELEHFGVSKKRKKIRIIR